MLVIQDPKDPVPPPPEFKSPNGITPATRDIQRRKWRKVLYFIYLFSCIDG